FLLIAPDARSTGMGDTGVAFVQGATAPAWNPSALGFAARPEFTGSYFKWLPFLADDMYFIYVSYIHPIPGIGTVGISFPFLSLGQQVRTDSDGEDLGTFESYDMAFNVSYGTRLAANLAVGANLKIVRSNLSNVGAGAEAGKGVATTFAVDVGATYRLHPRLSVAGVIQNIGPKITFIDADQADPQPRNLKVGFAAKLFDGQHNRLMLAYDFNKSLVTSKTIGSFNESVMNTGVEYWYSNFIALRTGYIFDKGGNIKTPTFGGGLQWKVYRIDFSYTTSQTLQNITKFSITAGF
ncbi:MAG: PorV/PorQ family protein, partial [candidate division Zixibacteria bacterium]|nr:PorV/PorQ family protein [candidate division Zixibacteria bacterium]